MKRVIFVILCLFQFTETTGAQTLKTNKAKKSLKSTATVLKDDEEKMSYLSGFDLGLKVISNINANKFPLRNAAFLLGIKEALEGKENNLTPEEIQRVVEKFKKINPQSENQEKMNALIAKNKKEGEKFLLVNSKKDSVKTTTSGLQFKVLRNGNGKAPVETSMVTVHYRGRLLSGVIFDDSYTRGMPAIFKLNQVIKGWTEGLQLMNEGAKYEFYIPNHLAYGEQPAGQFIPPGSTLIFEVELISVQ